MILALTVGLFAFRITHLVARDTIGQPLRNWFLNREYWLWATLLECYWCFGTYTSLIAGIVYWLLGGLHPLLFGISLAVSIGLAGEVIQALNKDN